ncbi:MAG TPA: AAA family ATPase [Wenzhouxiangella sp.]|nr:AAA family ATPase [Wenzhouxiangella sp.]
MNNRRRAIPPEQLRWRPSDDQLDGNSSSDFAVLRGTLGQNNAHETLEYALSSSGGKQHVFLRGRRGSGRNRLLDAVFARLKPRARSRRDFCFVHNFTSPSQPRLIEFAPGQARQFQRQMHRVALFVRERLPEVLSNDPVRGRREARLEAAERETRVLLKPLEEELEAEKLALVRSQAGPNARLQIAVSIMNKPVTLDEFQNMVARKQATRADLERLEERIASYSEQISSLSQQVRRIWQQAQNHIEQIEATETARLMAEVTNPVIERFRAPGVETFVREVIDDVLEKRIGHDTSHLADPAMIYGVNIINAAAENDSAPVIRATTTSTAGLFGTIDPAWRQGNRAVSSFHGIRSGALIQADGGFVVIDAEDLAEDPAAARQLFRVLRTGTLAISTRSGESALTVQSLRPQPVPVDVGVILVGDRQAWEQLAALSSEFLHRFHLLAELKDVIERDGQGVKRTCQFAATLVQEEQLLPLSRGGLEAIVELSARLSDQPQRLTAQTGKLANIIREAHFISATEELDEIGRGHVEAAFDRIRQRAGMTTALQTRRRLENGALRLGGRNHGQINVVTAHHQAGEVFGQPGRLSLALTASEQPQISLSLNGRPQPPESFMLPLLAEILHLERIPAICAGLSLEGNIDIDDIDELGATLASQLCLVLASLADVAIRQELVILAGVNARGQLTGIRHINERTEGFFDACVNTGPGGRHGVIIPAIDRGRLVLDKSIARACAMDQFHVYPVAGLPAALELLTGKPAGTWTEKGFAEDTVLGLARARLLGLQIPRG